MLCHWRERVGGVYDPAYYTDFRYGRLLFRLGQSAIEGSATTAAWTFYLGDAGSTVIGSAVLHGVRDQQPPVIDVFGPYSSPGRVDVRVSADALALYTTEPLPGTAKAWLVPAVGERIELQPIRTTFAPDLIAGFAPAANWGVPGTAYTVAVDGFVDLAGNPGAANLRIVCNDLRPDAGADGPEHD